MRSATLLAAALLVASGCGERSPMSAADAAPPDGSASPDARAALCDDAAPAESLRATPGVTGVEEAPCGELIEGEARCFFASISQPIVHGDSDAGEFQNRFKLVHRSCDAPTVLSLNGYAMYGVFYSGELAELFSSNWIELEHRFQGTSAPADRMSHVDGLTIRQAAADAHRAVETLRGFYDTRWVTTGVSKGGITAVYHRTFYPDDVDGTVPYVAPASLAREDPRYREYVNQIGPPSCRGDLRSYQIALVTHRREPVLERLAAYFGVSEEDAASYLDSLAARFEWGFWQANGIPACADIPTPEASDEAYWLFLKELYLEPPGAAAAPHENGPPDQTVDYLALQYEWLTEQGFALQIGEHVRPHLAHPPLSMEASFLSASPVELPPYDPSATMQAIEWVRTEATDLVLIYGENDPWTGGKLPAPGGDRAGRFFAPWVGHWASLLRLKTRDRTRALALVEQMMGREAELSSAARALRSEHARRTFAARRHRQTATRAVLQPQ